MERPVGSGAPAVQIAPTNIGVAIAAMSATAGVTFLRGLDHCLRVS